MKSELLNPRPNQPVSNLIECLSVSCSIEYFELRASDFGLRASDFGLRASDFGLRASDFGLRASDFGLRASDFGLRASDFLRISDFELRT